MNKSERLTIRLSDEQKASIQAEADLLGISTADLILQKMADNSIHEPSQPQNVCHDSLAATISSNSWAYMSHPRPSHMPPQKYSKAH